MRNGTRSRLVVAGSSAVVAAIVGVSVALGDTDPGGSTRGGLPATASFEPIADSPLGPRDGAVGVWTGSEVIVAGGTTDQPCPPNADCVSPTGHDLTDAAAYDPATDSWRRLADAPVDFAGGYALWTGEEMLVVSDRVTLSYDPATDTWQRLADLPDSVYAGGLIATVDGPVRFSYQQGSRHDEATDWRLDPGSATWEPLPADPFEESYDRSMAWHEGRLWLLSMDVAHHFEAYGGAPSRLAVLDGDEWRVVDGETPDLEYEQRLVSSGDRLVVPTSSYGSGVTRAFHPASDTWDSIPAAPADEGCPLGHAVVGPSWITAGGELASVSTVDAVAVPPCDGLEAPSVVVWAGERLLVWGGIAAGYKDNSAAGLVWTPAAPD